MESIKINDRLITALPFVRNGKKFADIGTDHAYLPIYLIGIDKISFAVAADINKGPLDKARENIEKYGYSERISTVLCDGLKKIDPNEVDDIAIFGMGGELIVKIIDEAPWVKDLNKRLILQPMTHPEKLRKYLYENGFNIIDESLSFDRGKIYQTICAEYDGIVRNRDILVLHFGECILSNKSDLLLDAMSALQKQLVRKISGKTEGGENVSYENELLAKINEYIER